MNRALAFLLVLLAGATTSSAIPRDEALVRARSYAQHPWRCSAANVTGGCGGGYTSVYTPGDYLGLPYDWGGYASLDQFDRGIDQGLGAGAQPSDGILDCTVGVDCSGFVSRVWKAAHTTTSGMDTITSPVTSGPPKPADAYNQAGYHVKLFERVQANGDPQFIESVYYNVHTTFWESWADVAPPAYVLVRYDSIEDTPLAYADGTPDAPVPVTSFPFVDQRDTTLSASDLLDACLGAAPTKKEQGPEVVYAVEVDQPGTLTVAVQDDAGVDIDVHVYRALNELDCVARDDKLVSAPVGCGTWYVVADTFTASTGDQPGPYTLTIDLEPSGSACGSAAPAYDFEGDVGAACDYDGSGAAPFCNPNLGATVCIYSSEPGGGSFCSFPCAADADCGAAFPGGCCEEVDYDYYACLTAEYCGGGQPEPVDEPAPEPVVEQPPAGDAEVVQPPDATPDVPATDVTPDPGLPPSDATTDGAPGHDASPDAAAQPDAPPPADLAGPDGTPDADDAAGSDDAVQGDTPGGTGGGGGCALSRTPAAGTPWPAPFAALLLALALRRRVAR